MKLLVSTMEANVLSFLFSCLFVSAIYVKDYFVDSPITSPKYKALREKRPYDDMALHPTEIKQRSLSIGISILLSSIIMLAVCNTDWKANTLPFYEDSEFTGETSFFAWMGIYPGSMTPVLKALLLNSMLFWGEIWYLIT